MSIKKNTDANFHFLFFFFVKETGDGEKPPACNSWAAADIHPPACSENIRRFDINHLFSEQLLEVKNKLPIIKK